uniref:Uncharacterized protein n=1 Tax=viral metagenome TaxID=1070528 RepID=A0A6C0DRB2_9ZZZZ
MKYIKLIIFILTVITVITVISFIKLYYLNIKEVIEKKIKIIYYAYLNEERWRYIVLPQMVDLLNCGLLSNSDLVVNLSGKSEVMEEAEREIRKILSNYNENVVFTYTYENLYEYPGILSLYEECNKNPEKIYLYFHSKGMFFYQNDERLLDEIIIFKLVITNWKNVINIFNNNNKINKVSFGCSKEGFCWYNFFWVRGEYITKCNRPKITDDRYYYESYIGEENENSTFLDCYNLVENNAKDYYSSGEIHDVLSRYKYFFNL